VANYCSTLLVILQLVPTFEVSLCKLAYVHMQAVSSSIQTQMHKFAHSNHINKLYSCIAVSWIVSTPLLQPLLNSINIALHLFYSVAMQFMHYWLSVGFSRFVQHHLLRVCRCTPVRNALGKCTAYLSSDVTA
jgi:hypothetical protein